MQKNENKYQALDSEVLTGVSTEFALIEAPPFRGPQAIPRGIGLDWEFETFQEFVIPDFLSFLKTPSLQILPDHL